MASSNKGFSHISVSAEEEDDVVIQAGAYQVDEAQNAVSAADLGTAPNADAQPEVEERAVSAATAAASSAASSDSVSEVRKQGAPKASGYQKTTLEDLENSKMSTRQKVIVVVAIIAVIAFAIYYLFFM